MKNYVAHAYITKRSDGKYDVWINGNKINESNGLGIQVAKSRAEDVIRKKGGGQITIEDENENMIDSYYV